MLKHAMHMAQVSAEVKFKAASREQELREIEAIAAENLALLEHEHQVFLNEALAAARAGELTLSFPGHELSLSRLDKEGFVAKRLTRRSDFEVHLTALYESKKNETVRQSDRVTSDCEGFIHFQGDVLYHRNSLLSLLETLWRTAGSKESLNIELVLANARVQSSAQASYIEHVKPKLNKAISLFLELKDVESKYQSVCWENLTVPITTNNATFVSWESAEDGSGLFESISAQYLKWLVTSWPAVSEEIGEWIEDAAKEGETSLELFVRRCSDSWRISRWPPPGSSAYAQDKGKGDEDEDEEIWWHSDSFNSSMFCAPSLAAVELELNGYSVLIEIAPLVSSANSLERGGQEEGHMRQMSIVWTAAQ
jgi:hypothetical protein